MEKFILAQTDEQRKEFVEKIKMETGWPDWKIQSCIKYLYDRLIKFGLEQQFPILDESEEANREKFFEKRKKLLEKYLKLREREEKILKEKSDIWEDLTKVNEAICELEGHRLSEHLEYEGDDSNYFPYRTCLVCGKHIFEHDLTPKDAVVQDNDELSLETILRK